MISIKVTQEGVKLSLPEKVTCLKKPHEVQAIIEELKKANDLLIENMERNLEENYVPLWEIL